MVKNKQVLLQMNKGSTDIYADGLIEHYALRSSKLNEMCLAEYATWYEYFTYNDMQNSVKPVEEHALPRFPDEEDDVDEDLLDKTEEELIAEPIVILPKDQQIPDNFEGYIPQFNSKNAFVKKRKSQKIIRCKRYNIQRQPLEYYQLLPAMMSYFAGRLLYCQG